MLSVHNMMLTWQQSTELTAALAVAGVSFRCARPEWTRVVIGG